MEKLNSEIIQLTGNLPLPELNVKRQPSDSLDGDPVSVSSGEQEPSFMRPNKLQGASPRKGDGGPYQALPVTGELITQHLTPALSVLDLSECTADVRLL